MRGISLAVTMGLIAATFHSSRKVWEPGRHWLGHQYPINNKKGYASRDKRASKKRKSKGC